MFRDQWLARERQLLLMREAEQMRMHRLAAGRPHKPAKPGWRRAFDRRAK